MQLRPWKKVTVVFAAVGLAATGIVVAATRDQGGTCAVLGRELAHIEATFSDEPAQDWEGLYTLNGVGTDRDRVLRELAAHDCD